MDKDKNLFITSDCVLKMKDKIVLLGGGGHCKSVINTIYRAGVYRNIVITDCAYSALKDRDILGVPVVGDDSILAELKKQGYDEAFITVGSIKSTAIRRLLYEQLVQFGFCVPFIVDPSAQISEYATLAEGVFIGQNAVVNAEARIDKMAIINTGAIIEHECVVGEYSHIAVGARLCGNVSVGSDVLIGAGATVIQGVRIGSGAFVGAGSIVLRDVKDSQAVVGLVK